jgi:hypothetical protein
LLIRVDSGSIAHGLAETEPFPDNWRGHKASEPTQQRRVTPGIDVAFDALPEFPTGGTAPIVLRGVSQSNRHLLAAGSRVIMPQHISETMAG